MTNKNHIISDGPLHDIRVLSTQHLEELYGIEIDELGCVWDPIEGWNFKDLEGWAEYYIEANEDLNTNSKIGKKQNWEDEY